MQAEDAGDCPVAQALAERALRLDRYTDSRYVRLAELLTLQNRVAAAIAVLDDAAEVARDLGDGPPGATKRRRDELLRRTAQGCEVGARRGPRQRMRGPSAERGGRRLGEEGDGGERDDPDRHRKDPG